MRNKGQAHFGEVSHCSKRDGIVRDKRYKLLSLHVVPLPPPPKLKQEYYWEKVNLKEDELLQYAKIKMLKV